MSSHRTLRAVGLALLAVTGCQTLLDIQQAEVDPSLESDSDDTPPPEPPASPPPPPPAPDDEPDAALDETSSAPEVPVCEEGFDNRRVKRLNADGTLPPLPDAPTPTESQ